MVFKITQALIHKLEKNPKQVLQDLDENDIASVIQSANYHYHSGDKPLLSDNLFDIIKEYLEQKAPHHPILKHVGAVVADDERKTELPFWMGSMDKIKNDSGSLEKWRKTYNGDCLVTDKLDGISALMCVFNKQVKLYTRGNGTVGQNISHLLPFIQNVPGKFGNYKELAIRGELIMSKHDFENHKDKGANGRNMVAGVLNAKVPNLEIVSLVQFISYEVIVPLHQTPQEQMEIIKKLKLKCVSNTILSKENVNMEHLSAVLIDRRRDSEFEIDGLVVTHNHKHARVDGENPKYAFAFKSTVLFNKAEVLVTSVEWNMSKDGYMKPVVLFDPVQLSGVVVRRATGFNGKFIKDNKIGPGAKILVSRSGDVIPHIEKVVQSAPHPAYPDIDFEWTDTGVDIVAKVGHGGVMAKELDFKQIEFFFSKIKADGVSTGILKKLFDGGVDSVGKVLNLTIKDMSNIDGLKGRMGEKVVQSISARMSKIDVVTIMEASNTFGRGIGAKKIGLVLDKFPQIVSDKNFVPKVEDLVQLDGIESKTANKFITGLQVYRQFIEKNNLQNITSKYIVKNDTKNKTNTAVDLGGKVYLFTGFRDTDIEDFIKAHNGEVASTLSKKVDVLLTKDIHSGTSKMEKAKALGITIMSVGDFRALSKTP